MKCSCPDWAVPCKHLAAVINVIANEIDRNPFLLFRFHDYDIVDELSKHDLDASTGSAGIFDLNRIYCETTPGTGEQDRESTACIILPGT